MSVFKALAELVEKGQGGTLCTILSSQGSTPRHSGSRMLVYPDGTIIGTVGGGELENRVIQEAIEAYRQRTPKRLIYSMVNPSEGDPGVCGGTVEVYVEPILPKGRLLIIGGGHVGRAVAHLCNPENIPDADEFYPVSIRDIPTKTTIGPETFLILVTRGVSVDVEGIPALLKCDAGYFGIIGSKKRWLTTVKALREQGVDPVLLGKIRSPIGLDIGAETPEEIAVSILAEVLMIKNQASGKPKQYKDF
jgi:xanthine dehydrogenase accessory factor